VGYSALLSRYLVFIHLLATIAILTTSLGLAEKLTFISLILVSLSLKMYQQLHRHIFHINYQLNKGWQIALSNGIYSMNILPSTIISPNIIVLHFKSKNHPKQTLFICQDMMSNTEFRRLNVTLKISGLSQTIR